MSLLQRPGIDQDPVKPWQWATMPLRPDPVEIASYPIPNEDGQDTIMVRLKVGDPTSIREVPLRQVACFSPDRHEWYHERKRVYYSDNPTVFHFADEKT